MNKLLFTLVLLTGALGVQAHGGHGMPGNAHWHIADVALVLAAVGALGLWLARRK
jgi:hypothetical protein